MASGQRLARFNRTERSWITYDWANSAYSTIITAAVFPIYFASVAAQSGAAGDIWWGYGTSIATLTLAVLAPILGAIGDFRGMKKRLFAAFLLIGLVFTTTMALTNRWQLMLVGYIISYIGFAGANLFYDSFLTDVASPARMDKVSAWGYAMGYIGGSTIPFIISIGLILFGGNWGIDEVLAVKISCLLCVAWWAVFSIPVLRDVHQVFYLAEAPSTLIRQSFRNLRHTLQDIIANKAILIFMLAYFFYIDGVNTVIHMATVYGSTLGLGTTGMILALLVTQLVAVPFSILFSRLAQIVGSIRMISFAIIIYFIICTVGFYMGYSLEPAQAAYLSAYRQVSRSAVAETDLTSLTPLQQTEIMSEADRLIEAGESYLASPDRADDFRQQAESARDELAQSADEQAAEQGAALVDSMSGQIIAFLDDTSESADYDRALERAARLFWAMAILVGTCQGGIQALSRSFFGKLIPPRRSNEYFGFFDIFGKFAAVIGPALYALIASLTGRSSLGILSLMLLFAAGLILIFIGRKPLREAEAKARLAAGGSDSDSV